MNFKNTEKLNSFLFRLLWKVVSFIPFNFFPRPFGLYTRYYLLKLFGAKIGKGIVINNKVKVYDPRNLYFEDFVSIGPNVNLYSVAPIKIKSHTVVSQYSELITATHNYTSPNFDLIKKGIKIGSYCWLSYGVYIGPGVSIGDNVICAARSVVSKSFLDNTIIIGGNPATFIKKFSFNDNSKL